MSGLSQKLAARLLLVLCGTAAFSTALALALQDRTLARDLEAAARERLERASFAANRLVDGHLEATRARYQAIAGTPQLRANLEVNDLPTLAHYAGELMRQQGAARILFLDEEDRPVVSAGDVPLDEKAAGVVTSSLVAHRGRAFAVASVELRSGPRRVGRLIAAEAIEDALVREWSDLCGVPVAFGSGSPAPGGELSSVVRDLDGLELRLVAPLDAERKALGHSRRSLLTAGGIALGAAFVVSFVLSQGLVRPIRALREAAERIGDGDLTVALGNERQDEIGDVARAFESMATALRRMVGRVAEAVDRVEATAAATASVSDGLAQATASQVREIDKASESMREVNRQVSSIAESARSSSDVLDSSVLGSSHSLRQLVATGSELRANASSLSDRVTETGASIASMVESARRIAMAGGALSTAADETAQSMDQVAGSTRTVGENARKSAELSGVVVAAAEKGQDRVSETIRGMTTIREVTDSAQQVIHSLGGRVKEIRSIAEVIERVSEETHLLALNASIIAAQSGEQGHAFAVVAQQMKALAQHVRTNTDEINGVVAAIQQESENAVAAIEAGSASVQTGVGLASEAGAQLEEITQAARESGERTREIVSAMVEQAKAAEYVVELMQRVCDGVGEIRSAGEEHDRGNEVILHSAELMQNVARQVLAATEAQASGTERVGHDIEVVQATVEEIKRALLEQSEACTRAAGFLELARQHTGENAEAAGRVGEATQELRTQAEGLRSEILRFRL